MTDFRVLIKAPCNRGQCPFQPLFCHIFLLADARNFSETIPVPAIMSYTIMYELCLLLELWGYCVLGLMPALIGFWVKPSPVVVGVGLLLSYHLMDNFTPRQLSWAYALVTAVWWVGSSYRDYADAVTELRLRKPNAGFGSWCAVMALTAFAQVDVLKPPRVRPDEFSHRGRISNMPHRKGRRPAVKETIPARQLHQKASPEMCYNVANLVKSYQTRHPSHLEIKASLVEQDLDALCWDVEPRLAGAIHQREEWGGEIAHVHDPDGSIHVVLHPEDVATVITAGWGERHPLCANDKRLFRLLFHGLLEQPLPVPEGLVLVYGPRNESELQVLEAILEAAVWYATRGELYPVVLDAQVSRTQEQVNTMPWGEQRCQHCTCFGRWNRPSIQRDSSNLKWETAPNCWKIMEDRERETHPALSSAHQVWAAPDHAMNEEDATEEAAVQPPQSLLPQDGTLGSVTNAVSPHQVWPSTANPTAAEHATAVADDIQHDQLRSQFSPGLDPKKTRRGPSSPPQSDVSSLQGEMIDMSKSVWARGGLHREDAQRDVEAGRLQHGKWEGTGDRDSMDFTEEDYF